MVEIGKKKGIKLLFFVFVFPIVAFLFLIAWMLIPDEDREYGYHIFKKLTEWMLTDEDVEYWYNVFMNERSGGLTPFSE